MTQIQPTAEDRHAVLRALSLPVLLCDAGPPAVVTFANAPFLAAIGTEAQLDGVSADALPFGVGRLLEQVRRTGASLRQRTELAAGGTWLLVADPVRGAADAVAEVVVTAVDLDGMVVRTGGSHQAEVAALAADELDPDAVVEQAVQRAAAVTGARRAVLYAGDEGDALHRLAVAPADQVDPPPALLGGPPAALPPQQAGGDPLVSWTLGSGPPPLPWLGRRGWERVLVHQVPREGGARAVLVVADPVSGAFAASERERLRLVAALLSTAWRNAELRRERAGLAALLRGALETSAGLVRAPTPAAVRSRLLRGLVDEMGFDAAALWAPAVEGDGMELAAEVGLPPAVRTRLARLAQENLADAITRMPAEGTRTVARPSNGWPGREVRLIEIPPPAEGVLGVYSAAPLPPLVDGILVTLSHALASAAHLTTLHVRSRTVVDALQQQVRPSSVQLPDGLDAGWWYESATAGAEVGGDFYDLFTTVSGQVGMVCGDVSGKGVEAASLTAMAVHALRAYAQDGAPPAAVVQRLNAFVCERTSEERFMTLAYALLDPRTGAASLTLAGHPTPVLLGPGGPQLVAAAADLPVGVVGDAVYGTTELTLAPGQALVLYTDGVTEARQHGQQRDELLGVEGLLDILRGAGDLDAAAIARAVWDGVQSFAAGATSDDCAIVVLRRLPTAR